MDFKNDLEDHRISSLQNFRSLDGLETSNSLTGICMEGGTFCVLSRVASQLTRTPTSIFLDGTVLRL